jgi:sugar/nucleoside kinase (ribokinase family)
MSPEPAPRIGIVGNLNVDQIVATVTRFPAWDEELIVDSSHLELAGTAGYLAAAARALGMDPFVVSTVGDDDHARFIRDELATMDIDASGIVTIPGTATCLGIIFVGEQGQRSILTVLGAHAEMSVAVAEQHDAEIAACPEVILCGSYLLPKFSPGQTVDYARRLRARGQTVVFDPSWDPGGWSDAVQAETYALLAEVDIYLPNEEELMGLTRTGTWRDGVAALAPLGCQVIVKRGREGASTLVDSEEITVPGLPVRAVNTIGAGDVFDMGFLHARRQGWDLERCMAFACAAAANVIAQEGKRTYPNADAILAFAGELSGRPR